jgi:hypothetical protein
MRALIVGIPILSWRARMRAAMQTEGLRIEAPRVI